MESGKAKQLIPAFVLPEVVVSTHHLNNPHSTASLLNVSMHIPYNLVLNRKIAAALLK